MVAQLLGASIGGLPMRHQIVLTGDEPHGIDAVVAHHGDQHFERRLWRDVVNAQPKRDFADAQAPRDVFKRRCIRTGDERTQTSRDGAYIYFRHWRVWERDSALRWVGNNH